MMNSRNNARSLGEEASDSFDHPSRSLGQYYFIINFNDYVQ
jgi:hypothetical protein